MAVTPQLVGKSVVWRRTLQSLGYGGAEEASASVSVVAAQQWKRQRSHLHYG